MFTKRASQNNFKWARLINADLSLMFFEKDCVYLDRWPSIAFEVLEASKAHMYDSFYSHFQPIFGPTTRIAMTDTDSFLLCFSSHETLEEKLRQLEHIMDFSSYPESS